MSEKLHSPEGLTLEEIRAWPATVSVEQAAAAIGVSRAYAYELVRTDEFPAKVLRVGGRRKVITSSLVALLCADA